jgi:Lipase (class 3)
MIFGKRADASIMSRAFFFARSGKITANVVHLFERDKMFNYGLLYNNVNTPDPKFHMHNVGMSFVCQKAAGGDLAGVKATLNLQALEFRDPDTTGVFKVLVARDQFGYQVYIAYKSNFSQAWSYAMQFGVDVSTNLTGKTLKYFGDVAELICTDLRTIIPTNQQKRIFFGGHSAGAAVSQLCGIKMAQTGYIVPQAYGVATPRFLNATASDNQAQDNLLKKHHLLHSSDMLYSVPPPQCWLGTGPANGPPLFENLLVNGDWSEVSYANRSPSVDRLWEWLVNANRVANWPNFIDDMDVAGNNFFGLKDRHSIDAYVTAMWYSLIRRYQDLVDEWRQVLNGTYALNLLLRNL